MNNKVVYFHRNPQTLDIFYVGIGQPDRPWRINKRSSHWKNIINKYGFPVVQIVHENISSKEAAAWETHYIKLLKRISYDEGGQLVNVLLTGYLSEEAIAQKRLQATLGKKPKKVYQKKPRHEWLPNPRNVKPVIDLSTYRIYKSGKDAAIDYGIDQNVLQRMLANAQRNKTSLMYLNLAS
jgi:hypothetical protein